MRWIIGLALIVIGAVLPSGVTAIAAWALIVIGVWLCVSALRSHPT